MWDFFQTVRHRHSIRRYQTGRAVEPEKLHAILEAAIAAPSAGDLQSYRILVVTATETRAALQRAAGGQSFMGEAPACLVFCAVPEEAAPRFGARGRELYALQDATIAAAYAQLASVAAGLGSTWVGYFDSAAVSAALDLDPTRVPVAMLSLGYPAELPELSPRRPITKTVEYR